MQRQPCCCVQKHQRRAAMLSSGCKDGLPQTALDPTKNAGCWKGNCHLLSFQPLECDLLSPMLEWLDATRSACVAAPLADPVDLTQEAESSTNDNSSIQQFVLDQAQFAAGHLCNHLVA